MKQIIIIGGLLMFPILAQAQVGVGTASPAPSAAVDIVSTARGLLIPRMTQAQRVAIASPATGLLVFQIDINQGFFFFDGTAWNKLAVVGSSNSSTSNETLIYTADGF
ncbi:hypothetical protein [Hymenobacter saemangeumensis]